MGKYVSGGKAGASFGPGSASCPEQQATAYDEIDPACWQVFGSRIVIGDTSASVQGGFEVFNFNIHNDGTQRAVPTYAALEGPVVV